MKLVICCFLVAFCFAIDYKAEAQKDITGTNAPIKVGILHSTTGTIGGSEGVLRRVIEMLVNETNKNGGLLGRKLVPVARNPNSNWPLFAEMARDLIANEKVDVVFGCWTSVSRKSVLSTFEELNSLLFYPVQYEGEECSKNVFYTGAAPNQQAIPAVDFLLSKGYRRFFLLGTDYVYPRTTNIILNSYLRNQKQIPDEQIKTVFTPFGHSDWYNIIRDVKSFAALNPNQPTAIVSTLNGDANNFFYTELAKQGLNANSLPSVAFSVGEREVSGLSPDLKLALKGHYSSWNYFQSIDNPTNRAFIDLWKKWNRAQGNFSASQLPIEDIVNDPMEAHYIGFNMWAQAVRQAQTTEVNSVRQAMYGQKIIGLTGFEVMMNNNHHLSKPIYIGTFDGNFDFITTQRYSPVRAQEWSPFGDNKGQMCDWSFPFVCEACPCQNGTYGFDANRTYAGLSQTDIANFLAQCPKA